MSHELAVPVIIGVGIALFIKVVCRFLNVTLWQCTKFNNCPWYLRWLE